MLNISKIRLTCQKVTTMSSICISLIESPCPLNFVEIAAQLSTSIQELVCITKPTLLIPSTEPFTSAHVDALVAKVNAAQRSSKGDGSMKYLKLC